MVRFLPISFFLVCSSAAHAMPIYSYTTDNLSGDLLSTKHAGGVNPKAGEILSLDTSYDVGNQIFTWNYEARPSKKGVVTDGFWLVVSDGPNPKGDVDEYAILYGDLNAGRVTAYVYSGQNNSKSFKNPGIFLDSFENAITRTEDSGVTSVSMSINTSTINSYDVSNHRANGRANSSNVDAVDWNGVSFGNKIGIWFHPTAISAFGYSRIDGSISRFNPGITGWYDTKDALNTTVPEPTLLALLSIGAIAGFGVFRHRREDTDEVSKTLPAHI